MEYIIPESRSVLKELAAKDKQFKASAYTDALESILIEALLQGGYPVAPDQWLNNEMRYEVPAWVFRAQEAIAGRAL